MSSLSRRLLGHGLAVVLVGPAMALPVHAQQVVGIVGAANAAPTGRAPGKPQRTLKAGAEIYFKDRIVTRRGGSAQLAFLDRSTLNVSENSDLVIDEFVYRPGEPGTMTAHLSRGVMRFVGGDISHDGGATIKTPVVTIGIRGGIGTIGFVEDASRLADIPGVPANFHGGAIVVNGYGTLTVSNGASQTVITRPGFAVFVGSPNEAIAAPVKFDMAAAKAMTNAVSSRAGQRGGASAKAAAAAVTKIGVATLSVPVAVPHPPSVNALDFTSVFHAGNALARNRSQAQQAIRLQSQIAMPTSSMSPIPVATGASKSGSAPVVVTGPLGTGTSGGTTTGPQAGNGGTGGSSSGSGNGGAGSSGSNHGSGHGGPHHDWHWGWGYGYGHDNGIGNGGHNNGHGNRP